MSAERAKVEEILRRAKRVEANANQVSADVGEDALAGTRSAIVADLEAGPEAIDNAHPPRWIRHRLLSVAGSALAAPGGTGKTTCVLVEKVRIATGIDLYGGPVDMPGTCIYVSAEDGSGHPRYLLQRIIADGLEAKALTTDQAAHAKTAVKIIGWPRTRFGPIMAADEAGNTRVLPVWDLLLELIAPHKPVYVTLDPSVLFGPGERLGNDAAAAFAALMHETAQQIGACVQTIDHVSQSVARDGIVDQYASRGGTGKVDESRLARQLVRVTPKIAGEASLPFGVTSDDVLSGRVLQLHWTKVSYAPLPPFAWLRRSGYWFAYLQSPSANEAAAQRKDGVESKILRAELAVIGYVRSRRAAGEKLGKRELERSTVPSLDDGRPIPVRQASEAIRRLLASGGLVRRDLPDEQRTGFRKDYIDVP
jgi:RecA-family ATPase